MQEIKLSDYIKNKRNFQVNILEDYITWKDECHRIIVKDNTPYVLIREPLSLSEMKTMVEKINKAENKKSLKGNLLVIKGNTYYIEGIGGEAIKASKNGEKVDFYRYVGTTGKNIEAQELLEKLYSLCELNG